MDLHARSSGVKCIDVYFLAYSQNSHTGAAIPAKICLEPFKGSQLVIEGASYGKSLLDSFIIAIHDLETYCGINLSNYTIVVSFEEHNLKISGSSGSLLFALAILQLLNESSIPIHGRWSATGVTSIDGFIDAVGAVPYKLRAAKSVNITTVFLPLLDKPFANVSGITKIYLTEIRSICSAPSLETTVTEAVASNVNKSILTRMYRRFLIDARNFINSAQVVAEHVKDKKLRKELIRFIMNRSIYVHQLINEGHIYSAASLSFDTYIRTLFHAAQLYSLKELDNLTHTALSIDNSVLSNLQESHLLSIHALTVLLVVLNRIKDSLFYVSMYQNLSIVPTSRVYSLAYAALYAYARALTVKTWYRVLKIVNASGGPYISMSRALRAVNKVLDVISKTIEFSPRYAPLSLDALASTRSYLANQLDNASRLLILATLRRLYLRNIAMLDPIQRIVPYLYTVYARDLVSIGIGSVIDEVYFYSIASLLAAATKWTENYLIHAAKRGIAASHSVGIVQSFGALAWMIVSAIGLVCILLALRPLHEVEKGLGLGLASARLHNFLHAPKIFLK